VSADIEGQAVPIEDLNLGIPQPAEQDAALVERVWREVQTSGDEHALAPVTALCFQSLTKQGWYAFREFTRSYQITSCFNEKGQEVGDLLCQYIGTQLDTDRIQPVDQLVAEKFGSELAAKRLSDAVAYDENNAVVLPLPCKIVLALDFA
jgi:hypothetical protein